MFPANFGYLPARSVEEAIQLAAKHGEDAKFLAGGHSLIPAMKLRLMAPRYLIDLGTIPDLSGVGRDGDMLVVGALTVHADVGSSELVRANAPGLADAALAIGDVQVRNRGTIGGSVAHADPGADFPVMLTALSASFVLQSAAGNRTVAADDFFIDFYTTAMKTNEVLTQIRLPLSSARSGSAYAKLRHPASGYSVVSAGVFVECSPSGTCAACRIAIGGLGGAPVRARASEAEIGNKALDVQAITAAAAKAAQGTDPDDDTYASADYKCRMAAVYTRKALEAAVQRALG